MDYVATREDQCTCLHTEHVSAENGAEQTENGVSGAGACGAER